MNIWGLFMNKIGQFLLRCQKTLTEPERLEKDEYAPEAELPQNFKRDFADKNWINEDK